MNWAFGKKAVITAAFCFTRVSIFSANARFLRLFLYTHDIGMGFLRVNPRFSNGVMRRGKLDGALRWSISHLHIFCFALPNGESWRESMKLRLLIKAATLCGCLTSIWVVSTSAFAQPSTSTCPFNVSDVSPTGTFDAMRDSVVLLRYARGMRGAALVAGTTLTATTVENNITNNLSRLDMNGNGLLDEDDATIISRFAFGYGNSARHTQSVPAWPTDGSQRPSAIGSNYASRLGAANINRFIDAGCPAGVMAAPTADQIAASRFLIQATFGPGMNDIVSFLALSGANHAAKRTTWINQQTAARTGEKHFQYLLARKAEYDAVSERFYSEMAREAFWKQALKNSDQLRQRMAFALSQILVVSSNGGSSDPFELAAYLDILADNAFGNYRDILKKIALSPAQGRYLSHLRNDGQSANPNENFAREILQLFAVGLFELDMNGEKVLVGGTPKASYDEDIVKGFAKIFTGFAMDDPYCKTGDPGWGIALANCADRYGDVHPSWFWEPGRDDLSDPAAVPPKLFPPVLAGWTRSMVAFPGRHSAQSKQLLRYQSYPSLAGIAACNNVNAASGVSAIALASAAAPNAGLLPAPNISGSTISRTKVSVAQANQALEAGIDNIFCHPNVGPFISKHLIKFFVTSNPTPGYVGRVAAVFNNNGSNVRGDMKAVITAILTDAEAVTPATAPNVVMTKFGKLREPMIRYSHILRAFNATKANGRYENPWDLYSPDQGIGQAPLQSPTVFNYYNPEFSPPGHISAANAIGPEFEITTTTSIAATQNRYGGMVSGQSWGNRLYRQGGFMYIGDGCDGETNASKCLLSNYEDLYSLQSDATQLFNYINLVLLGGTLSVAERDRLAAVLNAEYPVPTVPSATANGWSIEGYQNDRHDRVKGALWLAVHMPEFQIQR
jgi:uncharacterized protein (DUF1800 family)